MVSRALSGKNMQLKTNNDEHKRGVARIYDLVATPYAHLGRVMQPVRYRLLHRLLEIGNEHRLLDVGTGPGTTLFALRRLGYDGVAVGVDIARRLLDRAKHKAVRKSIKHLSFEVADMERLPFPDMSFDRVTCVVALLLSLNRFKAISEMARVLKEGGRGVIVEPTSAGLSKNVFYLGFRRFLRVLSRSRPDFRDICLSHYRGPAYVSGDELRTLIEEARMEVRTVVRSMGYTYYVFEKFPRR